VTRFYLDGVPVAGQWRGWPEGVNVDPDQAAFPNTREPYLIGYMTVGPELYFAGMLDELRVWNVARTQEEIKAAMNGELTGSEPGLAGYWKFNDSPGATTARDSSPNGNDASLKDSAEIRISDAPVTP
ncbi:MAG: LamG-like jellyroll fold domain-containing protein, partial [Chloroflexota bacterium]